MGLQPPNRQNWYLWYKFAQKRYTPLSDFYKIWHGWGVPSPHPHAKFHRCCLKNVGLQPPKSLKYVNCWYKFAPKGKLWGSTEKAEYRCTTTKLLVCNDTIIVLKITLHHSVSVITIFFIPKRYKKQPKTAPAPAGGEGYRGGRRKFWSPNQDP